MNIIDAHGMAIEIVKQKLESLIEEAVKNGNTRAEAIKIYRDVWGSNWEDLGIAE